MKEWFCEEVKLLLPHEIEMFHPKIMRTTRYKSWIPVSHCPCTSKREARRPVFESVKANCIILARKFFGAPLFDKRRIPEWEDAMGKLGKNSPHNFQEILKISFDELDERDNCIFLHMACSFVKMEMKRNRL